MGVVPGTEVTVCSLFPSYWSYSKFAVCCLWVTVLCASYLCHYCRTFSRACILRVCAGYATLNLASNGLSASNSIVFAQYTLALLELNHIMLYMINDKLKKR